MKKHVRKITNIVFVFLLLLVAVSVLTYILEADRPKAVEQVQKVGTVPTPETLLAAVNAERAKVGVAPLVIDERLNQSAQAKCDDMKNDGYFGHEDPVDGKKGYTYGSDAFGNKSGYYSENITQPTPFTVEQGMHNWNISKPHHEAIVDSRYTLTGFGVCGVDLVEHFYSPTSF